MKRMAVKCVHQAKFSDWLFHNLFPETRSCFESATDFVDDQQSLFRHGPPGERYVEYDGYQAGCRSTQHHRQNRVGCKYNPHGTEPDKCHACRGDNRPRNNFEKS